MEFGQRLLAKLDEIGDATFFVAGEAEGVLPGLEVDGVGSIGIPIGTRDAKALVDRAEQAPYGRGEETVVDTDVRRVWQIDPGAFALTNPRWATLVDEIVAAVGRGLGLGGKIRSDLYKLLIYCKGSHFAPHRDSEKHDGMFATLIVSLPSRHTGGTLVVRHAGRSASVSFADQADDFSIRFAAFYADCEHEIEPVTSGTRVCLVYNLSLARRKRQPRAPKRTAEPDAIASLLRGVFDDGSLAKVAIPLEHQYTEAGLGWDALKGADRARADALL